MTSNLGSDIIQDLTNDKSFDTIDFSGEASDAVLSANRYKAMKEAVMTVVGQHFRPEFINRIDESVVFHPLGKEHIQGIAVIQLDLLRKRLAERELQLELTDAAMQQLAQVGFDPIYGARPLKRAIQQTIENPLAQKILAGDFQAGQTIQVDFQQGRWDFS